MDILTIIFYLAMSFIVFISLHWVTEKRHGVVCGVVGILWPLGLGGLFVVGLVWLHDWVTKSDVE